jgi:hypothetical protein
MNKLYFLVFLLIITSCTSNDYIEVAELATIQDRYILNDTSLTRVNSSTKYISKKLEEQIDSALEINSQYLALAKFNVPDEIFQGEQSYDLVLLYLQHDTASYNIIVTTDTKNAKLIDILSFNERIWRLNAVYPDTSLDLHNMIAIEILEDRSIDRIDVDEHRFDVTGNGQIEYKYTDTDITSIFFTLNDNCTHCGVYTGNFKELSIKVEIRQGIKPGTLSRYFILSSPTECAEHYVRFENELINGVMIINNYIIMELDANQLTFKIKDYMNGCDELLNGVFVLNKTE